MTGFSSVKALGDAELDGRTVFGTWRKSPSQTNTGGQWFDLSMSPGYPSPQYYAAAPLVSKPLSRSQDGGLEHGGDVAPATKHLRRFMAMGGVFNISPMPGIICDYLLFYPFVDEGSTDYQPMTNSVPVPRYTTTTGVKIMAISVAARTGGQQFQVTYTNDQGVAGRITPPVVQNVSPAIGQVVSSQTAANLAYGPFLPLQAGDTGVRQIDGVQMLGADVGLFTLVLVKPLAQWSLRDTATAPTEIDYFTDFGHAPVVKDDAYLNLICLPQAQLNTSVLHGNFAVAWN